MNLRIDQSRHYHFLNLSISVEQLKLPVKVIGAIFKGKFLDRAWLSKLMAGLEKSRAKFLDAWKTAGAFLEQISSIVDAVQRVRQDIADLFHLVHSVVRRIFPSQAESSPREPLNTGGVPRLHERYVHDPLILEDSADTSRLRTVPPGTVFRDTYEIWCPELVVIPPDEFMMGSTEVERQWAVGHGASRDWVHVEKPQHRVRIEAPLAVGRYAVTFEEYDRFADATSREKPRDEGWGRGRRPVINVSWEDAKAYVDWLSNETGHPYRLLSEAEWEYAARAGTTTRHWWGDDITSENANFNENVGRTSETGTYPLNPWGLYETNGNVWEWGEDCWNENYEGAPDDGSAWTSGDRNLRVIRGGSWKSKRGILRAAYRNRHKCTDRGSNIGFRVARTLS